MFEPQYSLLVLDDARYAFLSKAVSAASAQADREQPKRKSSKRSSVIPQEQLATMLESGDLSYTNEEWSESIRIYTELLESGADLPQCLESRLALSHACLGEVDPAIEHATKSYENHPSEAPAYVALAKLCAPIPEAGLVWLQLASKARNIPERILKETKVELEETVQQNELEDKYAIPFLAQPNIFERVCQNPEFTSLIDVDELEAALNAVQLNMASLKETRGRSPGLAALLKILYNDSDVLLPQILSNDDALLMIQKGCPLHAIGGDLFRKIASFLPLPSIAHLQSTCKLNRFWANQPELWKEIYCRTWEPLQQSTFGVPLLPYMWKYHFKSRHSLVAASRAVFEIIMHQRADPSDIEDMRTRALAKLARQYRSSAPPTSGSLTNHFIETIDLFATSTTPYNAIALFDSPAFLTVMVTSLTRVGYNSSVLEVQTALMALICGSLAGGPQVGKSLRLLGVKSICSNLMFGPLHTEACALLAVLRLGETSYARPVRPVMPSSFWCANFSDERVEAVTSKLNGIWRHFMFYDNLDLKSVMELGASKLEFDFESQTIFGSGADTIGAFDVPHDGASSFNLRTGEVTIVRHYKNVIIEFVGIATPFGFGGFFQALPASSSNNEKKSNGSISAATMGSDRPASKNGGDFDENSNFDEDSAPVLLGYWMSHYMFESMTEEDWKVNTANLKSMAAKRGASKHPRPWAETPGPMGMLSQELRQLTRSTFIISLPSATYSDILLQLESVPEVSDEDYEKMESPPLLRGAGETDEKFKLRKRTHSIMMMLLFERRSAFGLSRWEEVENDLQILESPSGPDPTTGPAILHKWHDYLCLYTFDNYSTSSGVDGLCHWFKMILSMAQDVRARGQDPVKLVFGDEDQAPIEEDARLTSSSAFDDDMDQIPQKTKGSKIRSEDSDSDSDSAESINADDQQDNLNSLASTMFSQGHKAATEQKTSNSSSKGSTAAPKTTKDGTTASNKSKQSIKKDEEDEFSDSDEDSDFEESSDSEASDTGSTTSIARQKTRKRAVQTNVSPTTLIAAAGVIAAIGAGAFALAHYFTRPSAPKKS